MTVNDASPPPATRSADSFCSASFTASSASVTSCFEMISSFAGIEPASTSAWVRSKLIFAVLRSTVAFSSSARSSASPDELTVNSLSPVFTLLAALDAPIAVTRPASGEPSRDVRVSSNTTRPGTASVQCGSAGSTGASFTTLHIGALAVSDTESLPTVMPGAGGSFSGSGRV